MEGYIFIAGAIFGLLVALIIIKTTPLEGDKND